MDLVFGLFDLLRIRFSPRIKDLGSARLYRLRDDFECYPNLEGRLAKTIHALRYLESEAYRRRIGQQPEQG